MTDFWPDTAWDWALIVGTTALIFLPAKYDPAVRLKEWVIRKRRK